MSSPCEKYNTDGSSGTVEPSNSETLELSNSCSGDESVRPISHSAQGRCVFGLGSEPTAMDTMENTVPRFKYDVPDCDDLSAAVNNIQSLFQGDQSMAKFCTQTALAMNALKNIYNTSKNCPANHVLPDDPPGLIVPLMNHQKYALAWMTWREKQRPVAGGILADDMGLGKTVMMISLVLSAKNQTDDTSENKTSSSDEDDEHISESGAKDRKKTSNGNTLVVCPASVLRQWENEVAIKLAPKSLTFHVHHGPKREGKPKSLMSYGIVVTTFRIVLQDSIQRNGLFGIKWRRIIVDEAHVMRNHKSKICIVICQLKSKYRWALTGTPIHNKELDVYALLKFLHCTPFDDLILWKVWLSNKSVGGPDHLNCLLKSLMLRRTKAQLQLNDGSNRLPQKKVILVQMHLDVEEMKIYQIVMAYSRSLLAQFMYQRAENKAAAKSIPDARKSTHTQMNESNGVSHKMHEQSLGMTGHSRKVAKHEISRVLMRLRQICCHPGLINTVHDDDGDENTVNVSDKDSEGNALKTDLLAELNKMSFDDSIPGNNSDKLTQAMKNVLNRSNPVFNFNHPSSKIRKVLEILKMYVLEADDKVIIISQWVTTLYILQTHLAKEGLATLSINGKVPLAKRQRIINEFNDPHKSTRILLLSIIAGGVGINLDGANHLILFDLHWNPQLELQAQDRIYRVGQKKDVFIYKIVCEDTIEERIKDLQEKKLKLANGILICKASTLSIDEYTTLFGM